MKPRRKIIAAGGAGYGGSSGGITIALSESSFAPTAQTGAADPDDDTFEISVIGGNADYTVSEGSAWMSVDIASGTVEVGSPDTITVSYDITGLSEDTYNGTITVASDDASNSPVTISVALEITAIPNALIQMDIRDDTTEWPDAISIYDKSYVEPCYWATSEMDTWLAANTGTVTVGSFAALKTPNVASGLGPGGFVETSIGTYNPNHDALGNCTNDVDMSALYDGIRGYYWYYYNESQASDGVYFYFGTRPTSGGTDYGSVCVATSRSGVGSIGSNDVGCFATDGEGNTLSAGTGTDADGKYNTIQFEFVKGSHLKIDLVAQPANAASYAAPTWPINTGSGNYEVLDLSGANYSSLVPMSPIFYVQSSTKANQVATISGMYLEYRAIDGSWETYTDAA